LPSRITVRVNIRCFLLVAKNCRESNFDKVETLFVCYYWIFHNCRFSSLHEKSYTATNGTMWATMFAIMQENHT
jgi:hypothetical protein